MTEQESEMWRLLRQVEEECYIFYQAVHGNRASLAEFLRRPRGYDSLEIYVDRLSQLIGEEYAKWFTSSIVKWVEKGKPGCPESQEGTAQNDVSLL